MASQLTTLLVTLGFLASSAQNLSVLAQIYHIIPDNTTPCPTQTTPTGSGSLPVMPTDHGLLGECLTLTQYAQLQAEALSPAAIIDSNITLIFEPGNHTLGSRLRIQNVIHLVLQVAPTNSSPSSVAIVTCMNSTGFDFAAIFEITVSGFEFNDCRENSVRLVDKLRIKDSRFQDQHGIELRNVSSATFETSFFISLSAFREVWVPRREQYIPLGGAIVAFSSHINVIECLFEGNTAVGGGAIWTDSGSISIHGSDFSNNTARLDGGAIGTDRGNISIHGSVFSNNTARLDGGAIGTDSSSININASVFNRNTADSLGGAIRTVSGNIDLHSACDFTNNRADRDGGAILTDSGSITINGSSFFNNSVAIDGGAIWTWDGNISIQASKIYNNTADRDGGALWTDSGTLDIHGSSLSSNSVGTDGGAIGTNSGCVKIHGSDFSHNIANTDGGAIWIVRGSVTLHDSDFSSNTASSGGVLRTDRGNISINGSVFIRNTALNDGGVLFLGSATDSVNEINNSIFSHNYAASQGGAIYVQSRTISLNGLLQITSNLATTGVVYALKSTLVLSGNTTISDNRASIYAIESKIRFFGHTNIENNSKTVKNGTGLIEGGAITASQQSEITFNGTVNILYNAVSNGHGGAILLYGSIIYTHSSTTIAHNTAMSGGAGGGVYAYQSILNFAGTTNISENIAKTKGGGIYASGSLIRLTGGQLQVIENKAKKGGGICLEIYSTLYVIKAVPECFDNDCRNQSLISDHKIYFTNNSAVYGGALFSDESSTCDNQPFSRECFLQEIVPHIQDDELILKNFVQNAIFEGNAANISGGAIFGALLDRCTIRPHIQDKYQNGSKRDAAISFLTTITNLEESDFSSEISSETVGLCFCDENNQPNCDKPTPVNKVMPRKGETFSISLVAVDSINNPVKASVRVSLSPQGDLVKGQGIQNTTSNCTHLNFTITSPYDREELVLDAGGPCSYHKMVTVTFAPCVCPVGFVRINNESKCSCECDPCIYPEYIDDCSPSNSLLQRKDNIWISSVSYRNEFQHECSYLTYYPYCPFDYCYPSSSPVWINLSTPNGSNAQCAFNRSGKLCGSCKDGLSLSLGSSQCLSCSNDWLALLIVFAIAGVALVAFLLVCNLTVAVGTINGLIFYANILITNRTTFFPFQSPNFFTIFIAWLNLDFGFVTCFFNGMDSYIKEWLQLAFPIYIIFLVIIIYEYSTRITSYRLFTRTNPVATIATLILISYTKTLRVIIAAFSSATLDYPDGSQASETLWLIDANVHYLQGKHIPLFLVALLVFLVGIVYTSLLFSYLWLLRCPNRMVKLIKNARFYPFMDACLAPYNIKHRYWIGLLLLIRIFLYIGTAIKISRDPGNNLLLIICTTVSLLLLKILLPGRIYKSWALDALETSFILNLALFSICSLYILYKGDGNQESLAYTSTSIAFITFLAILIYHTYAFVLTRKARTKLDSFILKLKLRLTKQKPTDHEIILIPRPVVTYSVVDPIPTQQQLLENMQNSKQEGEDTTQIENESAANTEPSESASLVPEQTSDKNNSSNKQISELAVRLSDETRMVKDQGQKRTVNIELAPMPSKFSDIRLDSFIRDSNELGLERETEINDFIEVAD